MQNSLYYLKIDENEEIYRIRCFINYDILDKEGIMKMMVKDVLKISKKYLKI